MSMTMRVLLALGAGALLGLVLAVASPSAAEAAAGFFQPIGRLWLNALQMTVVPLVAALVVLGINAASEAAASGRVARNALIVFVVVLSLVAAFAAVFAPLLFGLMPRDPAMVESLRSALSAGEVVDVTLPGVGERIAALVPTNAIAAAAANAMLPLVVFSLFFGFALSRIEGELKATLMNVIKGIGEVMIVIVRWVLWAAPLGVFALVLAVTARVGLHMLQALAWYIIGMCIIYLGATLLMYVIARVAAGEPVRRFAKAVAPAQAIAASTQSSLASLPAMVESARVRLGYPLSVTSLVLPMAVSLFRINSPTQYIGVAAFIAWAYGIDLTAGQMAMGAALAVVVSMGAVGLPGQVSFMATNMPVVQSMALPVEPLGVLLALDTIPDVFATLGNVTADVAATGIVAKHTADVTDVPGAAEPAPPPDTSA
ncbi:MAG: cation:dicarboxylase symporter family transporter [Pseudoxanthomonas suwonensis]|nr:cation:dicarboxylase symporter family transporter [Pseudoxanthomonas suwonensis]